MLCFHLRIFFSHFPVVVFPVIFVVHHFFGSMFSRNPSLVVPCGACVS